MAEEQRVYKFKVVKNGQASAVCYTETEKVAHEIVEELNRCSIDGTHPYSYEPLQQGV